MEGEAPSNVMTAAEVADGYAYAIYDAQDPVALVYGAGASLAMRRWIASCGVLSRADTVVLARQGDALVGMFAFALERGHHNYGHTYGTYVERCHRRKGIARHMWHIAADHEHVHIYLCCTTTRPGLRFVRALRRLPKPFHIDHAHDGAE